MQRLLILALLAALVVVAAADVDSQLDSESFEDQPAFDAETEYVELDENSEADDEDSSDWFSHGSAPSLTDEPMIMGGNALPDKVVQSNKFAHQHEDVEESSTKPAVVAEKPEHQKDAPAIAHSFWHIADAEEDVDEHFQGGEDVFGSEEAKGDDDLEVETGDDASDEIATETSVGRLLSQMLQASHKLAASSTHDYRVAKKTAAIKAQQQVTQIAAYKAAVASLKAAKKAIGKAQNAANHARKACHDSVAAVNQKAALLTSIENKLTHLHEIRAEQGHSHAIDKEHHKLGTLVADLAEEDGDSTLAADLADKSLTYEERKQKIAARIRAWRAKAQTIQDKCKLGVHKRVEALSNAKSHYKSLIAPARRARSAAIRAAKAVKVAQQRVVLMRDVARRERTLASTQSGLASALLTHIPHAKKLTHQRMIKLAHKLHAAVNTATCHEELTKCSYDLGNFNGRNHISALPAFVASAGDACETALPRCHQEVKAAVDSLVGGGGK